MKTEDIKVGVKVLYKGPEADLKGKSGPITGVNRVSGVLRSFSFYFKGKHIVCPCGIDPLDCDYHAPCNTEDLTRYRHGAYRGFEQDRCTPHKVWRPCILCRRKLDPSFPF